VFLRPVCRQLSQISISNESVQLWRVVNGQQIIASAEMKVRILRELMCVCNMPIIQTFIGADEMLGGSYYVFSWRSSDFLTWARRNAIPYGRAIYPQLMKKSLECTKTLSRYINMNSGVVNAALTYGRLDIIEWYEKNYAPDYMNINDIDQFAACLLYKSDIYDKAAVRAWFEKQFDYTANGVKIFMRMHAVSVSNFNAALAIIRDRAPYCANAMMSLNYASFIISAGNLDLLRARIADYSVLLGVGAPMYTTFVYTALISDQFIIATYINDTYNVNAAALWNRICGSALIKAIPWYINTYGYNDNLASIAIDNVPNSIDGAQFVRNLSEYFSNLMYMTACTRAASRGKRRLIRTLHDVGCNWGPQTIQAALTNEHDDVADWLISRGCPYGL
jgi:hypothetical protein